LTISFANVDEVNYVLNALGERPHNQVRPLIDRIAQEAQAQIAVATGTVASGDPHKDPVLASPASA
jgi:hypothetical protein